MTIQSAKTVAKYRYKAKGYNTKLINRVKKVETLVNQRETHKMHQYIQESTMQYSTNQLQLRVRMINMARGDQAFQMTGSEVNLTGLAYRYFVHNKTSSPTYLRIAVIRMNNGTTISNNGEDLFIKSGDGYDFQNTSESEKIYLPLNRNKYNVVHEEVRKIGGLNTTYTDNFRANQIVKFYKKYNGSKLTFDTSGNSNDNFYIVGWLVDPALDLNSVSVELTGSLCVYYTDK